MAVKCTLAHGLQKCVGNLLQGGDFSDFKVVVEDTSFFCHRNILSACSGFFQGLFRSQMKESLKGLAKLNRMSKETFGIIINSIYKGTDGLTEDTVLDVWSATHMLQIEYLIEECKQFVIHSLSDDNCFRYLNHAMMYSAQEVIDSCLVYIIKNFDHVRNTESFLQLPFDYFYKVIESDTLATYSEDSVLDAILTWMEYKPDPEHCSWLYTGTLYEKTENVSECCENRENRKSHIMTTRGNKTMCSKNSARQTDSKEADRKQHFVKLISACRLFLVYAGRLVNLLNNQSDLIDCTGTSTLLMSAVKYSYREGRRHDGWPEAAVHRASSSDKHVMVFLSGNQFKAYSLDTGNVYKLAKLPEDCRFYDKITVVYDDLYLVYQSKDKRPIFSRMTSSESWEPVSGLNISYSQMLLAHNDRVFVVLVDYNRLTLSLWTRLQGHRKLMTQKYDGYADINNTFGFQDYIVVLITKYWDVSAHCFNTETEKVHVCTTSMSASSKSMVSFSSNEDVYVLEKNGSLWKVFSTDTTPVNFELVSKLWDFNCTLKGCVLYKKKLYIFHDSTTVWMGQTYAYKTLLTSLPGICEDIQMIKINSPLQCLPMVLQRSWLTS